VFLEAPHKKNSARWISYIMVVIGAFTIITVTSCRPFIAFSGPDRPDSEVAVLEGGHFRFLLIYADSLYIMSVDGKKTSRFSARLLPGPHEITIRSHTVVMFGERDMACTFQFEFEAGHHYKLNNPIQERVPWFSLGPIGVRKASMIIDISADDRKKDSRQVKMTCDHGTMTDY